MTLHYTHIGIETAKNAVALLPDVAKEPEPSGKESGSGPIALAGWTSRH